MKKLFVVSIITLALLCVSSIHVHAASAPSSGSADSTCSSLTTDNYTDCCPQSAGCDSFSPSDTNMSPTITAQQNTSSAAPAQTSAGPSCGTLNSTNYPTCCPSTIDINSAQGQQCTAYYYGTVAPAQANSCSTISMANYDNCCTGNGAGASLNNPTNTACTSFYYTSGMTSVPQQIGGGGLSSNPFNSASNNTGLATGAAPSSNSSQAVASCSAIQFNTLLSFAIWAKCIIGAVIIPGIFTLAFAVFLWGVLKFIRASEDKDKQEGKRFIYMGLIGLFVMVSVWGIIAIVTNTFGITAAVPLLQTNYLNTSNTTGTITPTSSGSGTSQ